MMAFMGDCAHADLLVPPIEGRIHELWDPIPVSPAGLACRSRLPASPDTEKAETDFAGEGREVDQAESTFRASMSGNFMVDP
uniref:Uncharacterized protein n=1 Tax=Brassica oleracea var. oleracea TaxID=109376 RepID=A0A0D3ATM8_BRAOL